MIFDGLLATLVNDRDSFVSYKAVDFLGGTGRPDKYGPLLLEQLQQASGNKFGELALALARLDYRPALPLILDHIRQHGLFVIEMSGYSRMAEALGQFGGDEVRHFIWNLLEAESPPPETIVPLMEALLQTARPDDIPRLIHYYRNLPLDLHQSYGFGIQNSLAAALATPAQADRLVVEMMPELDNGLWAILDEAEAWLGVEDILSERNIIYMPWPKSAWRRPSSRSTNCGSPICRAARPSRAVTTGGVPWSRVW